MKTGILRDDVTLLEWDVSPCDWANYNDYIICHGHRTDISEHKFPESWYTDIEEDHKPCPRCGGDEPQLAQMQQVRFQPEMFSYVFCPKCNICTTNYLSMKLAWEDWDKDYD